MPRLVAVALTALLVLTVQASPAAAKKLQPGETVDLNAATYDDLVRIPGVGKTRARAILEYREGHGPFGSVDDLDKVKGIGKKSLKKLVPWLRIGGAATPAVAPPATDGAATKARKAKPPAREAAGAPDAPALPAVPPADEKAPTLPKDEGKGAGDVEVL